MILARLAMLPAATLERLAASGWIELIERYASLDEPFVELRNSLCEQLFAAAGSADGGTEAERASRFAVLSLRRAIHNDRTLRSQDLQRAQSRLSQALSAQIEQFITARQQRIEQREELDRATEQAYRHTVRALFEIWSDPERLEALRLSSRSLAQAVELRARSKEGRWTDEDRYLAAKCASFAWRYGTKTSPFGLFCGTALAPVAAETSQRHPARIDTTRVLLSVAEVRKISAMLAVDDGLAPIIRPRLNPTARREGDSWTFWRVATHRRAEDDETLSKIKASGPIDAVVSLLQAQTLALDPLRLALAARLEIDTEAAATFLAKLAHHGWLIAELEIPYTVERPLHELAKRAAALDPAPEWCLPLQEIELLADQWGEGSIAQRRVIESELESRLTQLPHVRTLKLDELLRVDAACQPDLTISSEWVDEVRRAVGCYARMFAAIYPRALYGRQFHERWVKKFGTQQAVPLLDLYHGVFDDDPIAERSPLLVAPSDDSETSRRARERFDALREQFVVAALRLPPGEELVIDASWLEQAIGRIEEPRWSASVAFQVEAEANRDRPVEPARFVLSSLFHGTGLAFSRFASLHRGALPTEQSPLAHVVRHAWRDLQRTGTIVAELTYNHTARTANAGLRPALLSHEIELPGECASPGASVIPLRELVVHRDVTTGRFSLVWEPHHVEVLPIISSGVNPSGVISFLVHIGHQELQPIGLFVGFDHERVTHWPRVVIGKTVLFRERWVFRGRELPEPSTSPVELAVGLTRWRRRHRLPRRLFASTTTEPKPIGLDLDAPLSHDLLRRLIEREHRRPAAMLTLTEMLPTPQGMWVTGRDGSIASEFQIQMQHSGGSD